MKAVVLSSGGLDSSTVLSLASRLYGSSEVLALSFFYRQSHRKEITCSKKVAQYFKVRHQLIDLPNIFEGSRSTLIEPGAEQPHLTYQELQDAEGPSPTYVPFRNGIFIAVASAVALIEGASEVWIGTHAEDAQNWAYPDCTPEFIGSMASALYVGTYHQIRLVSPLEWMMKKDIVKLGIEISTPYYLTWTCYAGNDKACGKCPSCVERLEAFRANRSFDPIPYDGGPYIQFPLSLEGL